MSGAAVLACLDPSGTHWEIGPLPPPTGRLALIGWRARVNPEDAGVPEEVTALLAKALVAVARLTFPTSELRPPSAPGWWPTEGGDLACALGEVVLRSTRRPEAAVGLFDDAVYPWWHRGQIVLLSEPGSPPPDIDRSELLSLLGADWVARALSPAFPHVVGSLRPGVDGDVAGLASRTEEFERSALAALETAAQAAGFSWAIESEEGFASRLA